MIGARLAEHDRVDRFEVRRVRKQRQVNLVAVELAVRRGAEVIFHVARSADVRRVGRAARELVEDRAVRLAHHVRQDVQPAAVGHADIDLLDAVLAAIFDHRFQRRNRALAAVEPESFRADIFAREKLFPLLSFDDLGEDRLLALGRELDLGVLALDPLLDEAPLLQVVDVHIFDADGAAVIGLQHRDDLAHGRALEAERAADPDRPVEVVGAEAVIFGRQVGRAVAAGEGRAGRAWRRDGRARDRCGSASSRGWNLPRRGGPRPHPRPERPQPLPSRSRPS